MKKLITVILILSLILPAAALSDLPDVTAFSDQELKDLISACSQELMARNTSEPEGVLLYEYEGVRVYQTGDAYISSRYLYVPVAVYNDMDHEMVISVENCQINGWDVFGSNCRASGKAKKKDDIAFNIEDADVTSIDQISSLRFVWQVYDYEDRKTVYTQEEPEEHRFW